MQWTNAWPFLALALCCLLITLALYTFMRWLKNQAQYELGYKKCRYTKWRKYPSEICSICLEKFAQNNSIAVTLCKHTFHVKCLQIWFKVKQQCPVCKRPCGKLDQSDCMVERDDSVV